MKYIIQDFLREIRIKFYAWLLSRQSKNEDRVVTWRKLNIEIISRSAKQVSKMEKKRGLV